MRNLLLLIIIFLSTIAAKAQIKAITDTGDEVLLYNDGTWDYLDNDTSNTIKKIPLNEKEFTKSEEARFLVKSKITDIGVWLNPKEWNFTKKSANQDAEFQFQKKGEDLYGILISEKLELPLESLKNIALENARSSAPDMKLLEQEYRMVNGLKVLMIKMGGTFQGIKLIYKGYYYSNSSGTVQLTTFTGKNLIDEYKNDMHQFLNGLVEL